MAFDAKSNTVVDAVRALAKGVTSVGLKAIPEAWPPFWLQTQSTDLLPALFLDCTGGPAEADENPRTLLCRYGIDCYYVARWSTTAATNPYEVARNAAELLSRSTSRVFQYQQRSCLEPRHSLPPKWKR